LQERAKLATSNLDLKKHHGQGKLDIVAPSADNLEDRVKTIVQVIKSKFFTCIVVSSTLF
jgi:hypothetical protein